MPHLAALKTSQRRCFQKEALLTGIGMGKVEHIKWQKLMIRAVSPRDNMTESERLVISKYIHKCNI